MKEYVIWAPGLTPRYIVECHRHWRLCLMWTRAHDRCGFQVGVSGCWDKLSWNANWKLGTAESTSKPANLEVAWEIRPCFGIKNILQSNKTISSRLCQSENLRGLCQQFLIWFWSLRLINYSSVGCAHTQNRRRPTVTAAMNSDGGV